MSTASDDATATEPVWIDRLDSTDGTLITAPITATLAASLAALLLACGLTQLGRQVKYVAGMQSNLSSHRGEDLTRMKRWSR